MATDSPNKIRGESLAAKLKRDNYKDVDLEGRVYKIRRVGHDEFLTMGLLGPMLDARNGDDEGYKDRFQKGILAHYKADETAFTRQTDTLLTAGLVEPKVWTGTATKCPADHVLVEHLAVDRDALRAAIMEFAGLIEEVRKAATFSDRAGAGASVTAAR